MSNIQKQHKISPAIAWLTIQKFIIFYCPLDGEHTTPFTEGLPDFFLMFYSFLIAASGLSFIARFAGKYPASTPTSTANTMDISTSHHGI